MEDYSEAFKRRRPYTNLDFYAWQNSKLKYHIGIITTFPKSLVGGSGPDNSSGHLYLQQ